MLFNGADFEFWHKNALYCIRWEKGVVNWQILEQVNDEWKLIGEEPMGRYDKPCKTHASQNLGDWLKKHRSD